MGSVHFGWWEHELFPALCELQKLFCLLLSGGSLLVLENFSHVYISIQTRDLRRLCRFLELSLSCTVSYPAPHILTIFNSDSYLSPQLKEIAGLYLSYYSILSLLGSLKIASRQKLGNNRAHLLCFPFL